MQVTQKVQFFRSFRINTRMHMFPLVADVVLLLVFFVNSRSAGGWNCTYLYVDILCNYVASVVSVVH
jgi:hypothetical protein